MQDKTLAAPLEECKEYLLALDAEEAGDWPRAFEAFQSYSAGHPNSVFSGDAHERGAVALMHIAQEQVDQKDYQDALANMNRIVSEYSDTNIFTDALTLLPIAYTSWGACFTGGRRF